MVKNIIVEPLSAASKYLGTSDQAKYFEGYATDIGANKILVESHYIDKDYLIDFQKFYSRSFGAKKWNCFRIHFFAGSQTCEELRECLFKSESLRILQDNYRGFVVRKPVKTKDGELIIGRTVLQTYPEDGGDHKRIYITCPQRANLFGHELRLNTLPFQSQDRSVGACASAALWSASNQLFYLFEIPRKTLYEITEEANMGAIHEARAFPSEGLTARQMCACLRSKGLEFEFLNVGKESKCQKEHIETVLKAFIGAGIPIIAGISLCKKDKKPVYHAVVIAGYSLASEGFTEIYVHDDRIGPYASVLSSDGFLTWEYKRGGWSEYDQIKLDTLIIPLYHKIRLPFLEVWLSVKNMRKKEFIKSYSANFFEIRNYRKRLLALDFYNKEKILAMPMPHYLWVFDATYSNGKVMESVFDATAPYMQEVISFYHK